VERLRRIENEEFKRRSGGETREEERKRERERKKVSRRRAKSNLHRPSHRWNLYARQRPVLPSFLSHLNIFINILPATTTRHHRQRPHALPRLLATI